MSQVVFAAKKRTDLGTGNTRRLRKAGRIPGVVYGRSGKSMSIDVDALEFTSGIKGISESTIVKLDIEGEAHEAFVKDTQWSIITGEVLHVDFYEIERGVMLRAKVAVHASGNPAGVREGGILELPTHEIEVECLPKDLPERIDVDIADLKVNQSIHVRDLKLGDNVKIITSGDQVIALVKFAKADSASDEEAAPAADAPKA
ncbi:MAG: 50S ribosomal protein L25 [Treponema sp.]|jgi:large subunit ribosomal protein L25|nr:50S ribosomal protein L25 [Treponema sp.]